MLQRFCKFLYFTPKDKSTSCLPWLGQWPVSGRGSGTLVMSPGDGGKRGDSVTWIVAVGKLFYFDLRTRCLRLAMSTAYTAFFPPTGSLDSHSLSA